MHAGGRGRGGGGRQRRRWQPGGRGWRRRTQSSRGRARAAAQGGLRGRRRHGWGRRCRSVCLGLPAVAAAVVATVTVAASGAAGSAAASPLCVRAARARVLAALQPRETFLQVSRVLIRIAQHEHAAARQQRGSGRSSGRRGTARSRRRSGSGCRKGSGGDSSSGRRSGRGTGSGRSSSRRGSCIRLFPCPLRWRAFFFFFLFLILCGVPLPLLARRAARVEPQHVRADGVQVPRHAVRQLRAPLRVRREEVEHAVGAAVRAHAQRRGGPQRGEEGAQGLAQQDQDKRRRGRGGGRGGRERTAAAAWRRSRRR